MTIFNSQNDLVKTTIRKVLITATFVIIGFIDEDSQNNNEDLDTVIEASRGTIHSDNNQSQKHPKRNRPVNQKQRQNKSQVLHFRGLTSKKGGS